MTEYTILLIFITLCYNFWIILNWLTRKLFLEHVTSSFVWENLGYRINIKKVIVFKIMLWLSCIHNEYWSLSRAYKLNNKNLVLFRYYYCKYSYTIYFCISKYFIVNFRLVNNYNAVKGSVVRGSKKILSTFCNNYYF